MAGAGLRGGRRRIREAGQRRRFLWLHPREGHLGVGIEVGGAFGGMF